MSYNEYSILFLCGGCGKKIHDIEELSGEGNKVCSTCGFSLFMIVNNQSTEYAVNHSDNKQHDILNYIKSFLERNGHSPSIKEIQDTLDLKSVSTVYYHLNLLKDKGFITFKQGKLHTLKVLPKALNDSAFVSVSNKQIHLLKSIHDFTLEFEYAPTNQELQERLGMKSIATLAYHIKKLQEIDFLEKSRYRHRSLALTNKGICFLEELGLKGVDS